MATVPSRRDAFSLLSLHVVGGRPASRRAIRFTPGWSMTSYDYTWLGHTQYDHDHDTRQA
eukprot:scaffold2819_cov128-Isochrysis_galbana.AAC.5